MPSTAYLMLRSRRRRHLEARTAPLQPSLSDFLTASFVGMTTSETVSQWTRSAPAVFAAGAPRLIRSIIYLVKE